jgi:Rrf2 family protein
MNQGVEWAIHGCVTLAWVGPDTAVPVARLAELNDLPAPYLNKQLQALARAGILGSTRGPKGGFTLARSPAQISVLDVVLAIEGDQEAFRCTEIRQRGPLPPSRRDCRTPCQIASVMHEAEQAWRATLAGRTIADIAAEVEATSPGTPVRIRTWTAGAAERGGRPSPRQGALASSPPG